MTQKQINNISLADAMVVLKKNSIRINMDTPDNEIKTIARTILRNSKQLSNTVKR